MIHSTGPPLLLIAGFNCPILISFLSWDCGGVYFVFSQQTKIIGFITINRNGERRRKTALNGISTKEKKRSYTKEKMIKATLPVFFHLPFPGEVKLVFQSAIY